MIIFINFGIMGNVYSEYLGLFFEIGFLGMLIVFVIVGIIFYFGIDFYNCWLVEDKEICIILMVFIVVFCFYFIYGFFNNYLDMDKVVIFVWCLCVIFVVLCYRLKY